MWAENQQWFDHRDSAAPDKPTDAYRLVVLFTETQLLIPERLVSMQRKPRPFDEAVQKVGTQLFKTSDRVPQLFEKAAVDSE